MAFCIHCGAQNTPDAIFCLSCGQTLYQEPKAIPQSNTFWLRNRLLLGALLGGMAIWLLMFSVGRTHDPKKSDLDKAEKVSATKSPVGAPVLTIVALSRTGTAISQGSGFILSSDGLAGSNYHVIKGADAAVAECCNGRLFEIRSIEGADLDRDLVVFQLYERGSAEKPQGLPSVTLGSSRDLTVGDKVIAIGSPQGLENTISDGILSAIREYKSVRYLQITAPISPGSSGGPVLSDSGKMVGVATFQFEKGQNLNFAVDAEHIRPLIDQHFGVSLEEFQSAVRSSQHARSSASASGTDTSTPRNRVSDATRALTGEFGGIVHNESVHLSAEMGILVRDDDGILSGCMGVEAPLFGSGPLTGFVTGDNVSFAVTSSMGKITFTGHHTHDSISGTYIVEHENRRNEEGSFTLQKAASKGSSENFDPTKCPTDAEIHE